jgi:hypothetical protein
MNVIEILKAKTLLANYIHGSEDIVVGGGQFALQVCLNDGSQKTFKDIQRVIDWVQVQKIKRFMQ